MSDITQPTMKISFEVAADTVISRLKSGVTAVMVRDAAITEVALLTTRSTTAIPSTWGADTVAYVSRAYTGSYLGQPEKVLLVTIPPEETDDDGAATTTYFADALDVLYRNEADFVVPPLDATETELAALILWVKLQRENYRTYKAIVSDTEADDKGIINVSMAGTVTADGTLGSADLCPRIGGILAGLPYSSSITACPLDEVVSVPLLDLDEQNELVADGKLFLTHDGRYARVSRGVTSLTTVPAAGNDSWKKIKIVNGMDLITYYARITMEDAMGKMVNNYDNKQILVGTILSYFALLNAAGVINDTYSCEIDVDEQELWLQENGTDTSDWTETQIAQANTGSQVYLKASVSILDAMEDFDLAITMTNE